MLLLLVVLSKVWPTANGRMWFERLASKIRREVYGGLSSAELMGFRGQLFHDAQHIISTAKLHAETFKGFKGAFRDRDVVIVGAGPSLNKYRPIAGAIHIGLNRACSFKGVKLDYFFAIDKLGVLNYYEDLARCEGIKFIGDQGVGKSGQIPESIIPKLGANVRRYRTDGGHLSGTESAFAVDLETMPLGNFHTVAMQALQFALYGHPRRIYLVGIDCSANGHFDNSDAKKELSGGHAPSQAVWANAAAYDWIRAKDFIEAYYPDVEIVSVNPVGLRGLFTDLVQE